MRIQSAYKVDGTLFVEASWLPRVDLERIAAVEITSDSAKSVAKALRRLADLIEEDERKGDF